MIVYRCASERELACMIGIPNVVSGPHGKNTFKYEKNTEYKHFFYHYDSAKLFMDSQNLDRYYNRYTVIMAYDIDNKILKKYFGLGEYNLGCISSKLNDSILKYFKTIWLPEFSIPSTEISKDMVVGIGDKRRITPISYVFYNDMDASITESNQKFLEYEKWLFQNGTNVKEDLILENSNNLFPINSKEYIKK